MVGGRSSRFGRDKALTPFLGRPLLLRVLDSLSRASVDEVIVSVGRHQQRDQYKRLLSSNVKLVVDEFVAAGPLSGLVSSLASCNSPDSFLAACDLVFLSSEVAEFLLQRIKGFDAVVPRWANGTLEPTHAVYGRGPCEEAGKKLLGSDKRHGLIDMIASLGNVDYVDVESEISAINPSLQTFQNLNTHSDFASAESVMKRKAPTS